MNIAVELASATERVIKAQARLEALQRKAKARVENHRCRGCDKALPHEGRGRPRVWCEPCRNGAPYKKWFKATYAEKFREYQRTYRRAYRARLKAVEAEMEAKRGQRKAKKRAMKRRRKTSN